MRKLIARFTFVLAALAMGSTVQSAEVTSEQAKTAAQNWIRSKPRRMNSRFVSANVKDIHGNTTLYARW